MGQLGRAYNNVENYAKGLEILKTIEFEKDIVSLGIGETGLFLFFLAGILLMQKSVFKSIRIRS